MKRTMYPVLFVWIPLGIQTGTGMDGITQFTTYRSFWRLD